MPTKVTDPTEHVENKTKSTKPSTKSKKAKSPTPSSQPKKPRQKKLSLKSIQAKEADIHKLSTYIINQETNEVIKYYKIFDEFKIQELINECFDKIKYAEENGIEYFTQDSHLGMHISYLIVKHFTHLEDELRDSTLEQDIAALNALVSTGLYYTILEDVLDPNEILKVTDKITKHIEGSAKALEAQAKMQQDSFNMVQSPVIKSKLQNTETYRNVLS